MASPNLLTVFEKKGIQDLVLSDKKIIFATEK